MPVSPPLPESVFKAYDIRGTVPEQINPAFARTLGRALGRQARERGIAALVVGYDGRLSSPQLTQSLREGILSESTGAIDIGMAPTPRSEEHPSELQSLMRISYAVFCLKQNK